jgi:hypothetical protein
LLIEFFAVSWRVLRTFDTDENTRVSPPLTVRVFRAVRSLDARVVVRLALLLAGFFFMSISSRGTRRCSRTLAAPLCDFTT